MGEAGVRSWTWSPGLRLGKTGCPLLPWGPLQRLGHHHQFGGGGDGRTQAPSSWRGPPELPASVPSLVPSRRALGVLTVNGQAMPGWSCCPRKSNKVAVEALSFPQRLSAAFAQGLPRVPASRPEERAPGSFLSVSLGGPGPSPGSGGGESLTGGV